MKIIKVSNKGQISIPQIFRERLGIERGDDLILFEIGGKLLIEKPKKILDNLKDEFKDILSFSEQSLKEVWGNPEDEIWGDYLK